MTRTPLNRPLTSSTAARLWTWKGVCVCCVCCVCVVCVPVCLHLIVSTSVSVLSIASLPLRLPVNTCSFTNSITRPFTTGKSFKFKHLLGPDATQAETYDKAAKAVVQRVTEGVNGTVLCYGQTGSGKTHTMFGSLPQWSTDTTLSNRWVRAALTGCTHLCGTLTRTPSPSPSPFLSFSPFVVALSPVPPKTCSGMCNAWRRRGAKSQ